MKIIYMMVALSIMSFADFSKSSKIVTDSVTGLQWQDDVLSNEMTWLDAMDYCEALVLDGESDWRLPNINELITLIDDNQYSTFISPVFTYTHNYIYWTSTSTISSSKANVWLINFEDGATYFGSEFTKYGPFYVRCVRAGQ